MTKPGQYHEHGEHTLQAKAEAATPGTRIISKHLVLGASRLGGRGLFAAEHIDRGVTIVISPAILVPRAALDPTLSQYAFVVERSVAPREPLDNLAAIVFGACSICNHSDAPNAEVVFNEHAGLSVNAELRAIQPILPGDEIVIRYPDLALYKLWGKI